MKRKLTIIIIILLIIILVVGGLWMLARNKATKNNSTPPTFREFMGLGVSTRTTNNSGGDTLSSDFVNPPEDTTTPTESNVQNIPIATSIFTNGNGSSQPGLNTGLGGATGGNSEGSGGGTGGGVVILPPPQSAPLPECSDTDTNITFTPEEIAKLNILKNRFFQVAETLRTDTDVATELANYDTFKARSRKITELYQYCINSTVYTSAEATTITSQPYGSVVAGTNGAINYRVPTPFWHDFTKDNQAFIHQGGNWMGIFSDPDIIFPERSIEHALRINLW